MTPINLDAVLKYGSISSALLAVVIYIFVRIYFKKKYEFIDVFTVGTTASSIPSGGLLIYGAYDPTVIQKISDSNLYIAFAGIALLYVGIGTVKDKLLS